MKGSLNDLALCAGIGGIELGLKIALGDNIRTVGYVEREGFAASNLVARMEDKILDKAPIWDDLRSFDGKPWRGRVDLITGGYPCQPFSQAGKGLAEQDPRHLWPEFKRIIGEISPSLVFCENVQGHVKRGFEAVVNDLHGLGYTVTTGVFSASEVGAPHERRRLFFLADRDGERGRESIPQRGAQGGKATCGDGDRGICMANATSEELADRDGEPIRILSGRRKWQSREESPITKHVGEELANATGEGLEKPAFSESSSESREELPSTGRCGDGGIRGAMGHTDQSRLEGRRLHALGDPDKWLPWPPGPEDTSSWLRVRERTPHLEPAIRRVVDGIPDRVDRLRALGNGVLPLVAANAFITLANAAGILRDDMIERAA